MRYIRNQRLQYASDVAGDEQIPLQHRLLDARRMGHLRGDDRHAGLPQCSTTSRRMHPTLRCTSALCRPHRRKVTGPTQAGECPSDHRKGG